MNIDSNDKARPRIGVTGEAFDMTTEGAYRDGATTSDEAYNLMSGPHS